jgi:hypothetical protein
MTFIISALSMSFVDSWEMIGKKKERIITDPLREL